MAARARIPVCLLFLLWLGFGAPVARALTLYEVFALPAAENTWQQNSLLLKGDQWRIAPTPADIGSPSGPIASAAQMQSVLGDLGSVEIGGVCTGGQQNSVSYPCSFALSNPDLAGLVSDDFLTGQAGWNTTANRVIGAGGLGWSNSGGNPGGRISATTFDLQPTLLTLLASPAYLGNQSAAYNGTLSFYIEDQANPAWPVSYSYGVAILMTPEPGPWALVPLALATLLAVRVSRRRSACSIPR